MSPSIRVVVFACATLLTACASGGTADDSTVSSTTDRSDNGQGLPIGPASTPATIVEPVALPAPTPPRATIRVADQLRRYLDRVLGGPLQSAGLHRHIRQVSVGLHVATIHTDLSSDDLDKSAAEQICLVASWFRRSPEGRHVTALDVEVHGQSGDVIAVYDDLSALAATRHSWRTPRQGPAAIRPASVAPSPMPRTLVLDRGREAS